MLLPEIGQKFTLKFSTWLEGPYKVEEIKNRVFTLSNDKSYLLTDGSEYGSGCKVTDYSRAIPFAENHLDRIIKAELATKAHRLRRRVISLYDSRKYSRFTNDKIRHEIKFLANLVDTLEGN
tara:strand:+ start:22495 stop:22860 length:366 start_codon:yes stop_codon:yes gene_type:complete